VTTKIIPRRLRLLRIDDDLTPGGNPKAPGFHAQRVPQHLETVNLDDGGQPKPGIGSWQDAVSFWTYQKGVPNIDLVVSDVRFDDDTSPIVDGWNLPRGAWLPTGLSHFKAFAALARATGRPLGVGLHTKEARIWRKLADEQDPLLRLMGNLAAHEIGELAALLGYGEEIGSDATSCWRWLEDRTLDVTDFREAVPRALESFRRNLGSFKLLPADYEALVAWCGGMEAAASGPTGKSPPIDDKTDIGFTVMFPDGSRHVLSIRSLFADVLLERKRFQFEREGLPRSAFQLVADEKFSCLDGDGNPKIGALVHKCGEYGRAFRKALEILDQFPPPPGRNAPFTLAEARARVGADGPATSLAILFQDVRREYELFRAWRTLYEGHEWHPIADAFGEATDDLTTTLRSWLQKVSSIGSVTHDDIMEMFEYVGFDRDDESSTSEYEEAEDEDEDVYGEVPLPDELVEEEADDCAAPARRRGWPGTKRCIRLLVDMGILVHVSGTERYVPGPTKFDRNVVPPVPKWPPRGFMQLTQLGPAIGTDLDRLYKPQAQLRNMLGYTKEETKTDDSKKMGKSKKKGNSNSTIQRWIAKGFGLTGGDTEATAFLDAFRLGTPRVAWVKEACRDYARHIGWDDEATWPEALR
jgi:hypothetical protein